MEAADFLGRLVVVEDLEIVLLEVGDPAAMLVGHGEDNVDLVGGRLDRGQIGRRRV